MNENKASRIQKFFQTIFPASWARSMEESSRSWMVRCPNCNFEKSVWDWGGIRWGASGLTKQRLTCPSCQQKGWHSFYQREESS